MLNAFEPMKAMIEAGAAGVHFEDQLASAKKCASHGRQGAGADVEAVNKSDCCAPRSRYSRRTDGADRPAPTQSRQVFWIFSDADDRITRFIEKRERSSEGLSLREGRGRTAIARGLFSMPRLRTPYVGAKLRFRT